MELSQVQKQKSWQDSVFEWFVAHRSLVHLITNISYLILVGVVVASAYSIDHNQEIYNFFAVNRAWFGRLSLIVLVVVLTPGILGRFAIELKVSRVVTLYRRRLGILVFALGFTHGSLVNLPKLVGIEPFRIVFFQVFGVSALLILFLMFVTSNNFSVKKLGKWWKSLHRLVYLALLLILIHTALQRVSLWSVLAGVFLFLELVSFAYASVKGGSFFNKPTKIS